MYRAISKDLPAIGKRLDDLMYEKNISASELALRCGVDRKTIYGLMDGQNVNVYTVAKVADILGTSIDFLMRGR